MTRQALYGYRGLPEIAEENSLPDSGEIANLRIRRTEGSSAFPAGDLHPADPHIVFDALGKEYGSGGNAVQALSDVSFSIDRGQVFGIIGRSGAGKSTLLRSINMLERPSRGTVLINGIDVSQLDENNLVSLRRRVGMIFQHFNLLSAKTVAGNVGLPLRVAGVARDVIEKRVDALLDLVGLQDKADAYPAQLSGGQKQRVGIARALVHDPEILLCDEATSALDPETTQSILSLVRDINRKLGLTVVLITHDMAVIREICQHVLVLDQGRVAEQGEVWQVFGNPQAVATRALLRPLLHAIPVELSARLAPAPQGSNGLVVLSLRYTGAAQPEGVSLQTLRVLGPHAQLLHGGLDQIAGHAQGNLLVALPAAEYHGNAQRIALAADYVEVIGYVSAGD